MAFHDEPATELSFEDWMCPMTLVTGQFLRPILAAAGTLPDDHAPVEISRAARDAALGVPAGWARWPAAPTMKVLASIRSITC